MIIDMHTHILPHVDDGAADNETTFHMLQRAQEEGTDVLIATPHFCHGMDGERWKTKRDAAWKLACEMAQDVDKELHLLLGAEVYMESGIRQDLEADVPLTMNGSDAILIEFSTSANYRYIKNMVLMLLGMGYEPVLAHIERYHALSKIQYIQELSEMGAKMQANADSILGHSGWKTKRYLLRLLDHRLIDMVASDAHDMQHRMPGMKKCVKYLHKKLDSAYCEQLFGEQARQVFLIPEYKLEQSPFV